MKYCCCLLLFAFNVPSSLLCALTLFYVFKEDEISRPLQIYSLISGGLLILLPLGLTLYWCRELKLHSKIECRFHWSIGLLCALTGVWGAVGFVMIFLFGDEFPPLSSYGGFTIFSMLLFSFFLFAFLILLLYICLKLRKIYPTLLKILSAYILISTLWLFLGTKQKYKDYPFFTFNLVAALLGTLLGFILRFGVYKLRKKSELPQSAICPILVLQTIGGICFPLMPVSVLVNFILLMVQQNVFVGDTYSLACLGLISSYFLGLTGIVAQIFHIFIDISLIQFGENNQKPVIKLYNGIPLSQGVTQLLVLLGYFLFAEENLPGFAVAGAACVLGCLLINLALQTYFQAMIGKFLSSKKLLIKKTLAIGWMRIANLVVGIIVCSVLLAQAQESSNIFYEFPQFSLFMLLSIFYFAHLFHSILLLNWLFTLDASQFHNYAQNQIQRPRELDAIPQEAGIGVEDVSLVLARIQQLPEQMKEEVCAICLAELAPSNQSEQQQAGGEVIQLKKCKHYFHSKCIRYWLSGHTQCPIDRRQVQ